MPLWLVLLLVGVYAFPKRETGTGTSSRVTAVVVSVACALAPVVMATALVLMFLASTTLPIGARTSIHDLDKGRP